MEDIRIEKCHILTGADGIDLVTGKLVNPFPYCCKKCDKHAIYTVVGGSHDLSRTV